jgi:hypothetical protein
MWLFTNPPKQLLEKKYGFNADAKWLTHVQKSSVRFPRGSGSFVSPDGLVMTNHHVAAGAIERLSSKEHDYVRDGFHAKRPADELKCEALELNVLQEIVNVTKRVNDAVKPGLSPEKAAEARRAVISDIEKESLDKTKLKSQVVTLYQGAIYHLYRYKKYTDVRLVFAPEGQIAFYGGDPDNFEYPRYDLDVTFFRAYEDGKPARTPHYLKWSSAPLAENDLVFVAGHPGRTSRMLTVAELEYLRDVGYPFLMQRLNRLEVLYSTFSDRSAENRRQAKTALFGVQNSRKAYIGMMAALLDPTIMGIRRKDEKRLRAEAARNEKLAEARGAWDRIAKAQKVRARHIHRYTMLEGGAGFNSSLFGIARTLVRAGDELPKPNKDRLSDFGDAKLPSLKLQLFSKAPIYEGFETAKLTDSLTFLANQLGGNDPLVKKVLAGKTPSERAYELVSGTKLKDVAVREELFKGGKEAVAKSNDPMLKLARLVDAASRAERKVIEDEVEEVKNQAYAQIAKVKFALEGTSTYPDATFTLRLAFGTVKGYQEQGRNVPFRTTFAGLYRRAKANNFKAPFDLPDRWVKAQGRLNLKIPFNFVMTADIIGGNSGSPVINRNAEIVGLIFDGNIQSLAWEFAFSDRQARSVAVDAQGIIEALRKVYDANDLADELTGRKAVSRR